MENEVLFFYSEKKEILQNGLEISFIWFCLLQVIWSTANILCWLSLLDHKIEFSVILQMNIPYSKHILFFIPIGVISGTHMCRSESFSVSRTVVIYLKYIFPFIWNMPRIQNIFFINWWINLKNEIYFYNKVFWYGTFLLKLKHYYRVKRQV